MYYQNSDDERLLAQCRELIKRFGYEGLFDLEFLVGHDGKLYFQEVNLRSAMSNYAQMGAGINLPKEWSGAMLKGTIELKETSCGKFTAINEFYDFFALVVHGKINLFRWLKNCLSADVHLLWNRKDIKPFFVAIKQKISRSFNHINM